MTCNLFTGAGFDMGFLGEFGKAWFIGVVIFFVVVLLARYISDYIPFNKIGGFVFGFAGWIVTITLSCSVKWSLAVGLVGVLVGGLIMAMFLGGDEAG